jgi:3-oxoacyl-[acyl-carrier-protein] synthase-1
MGQPAQWSVGAAIEALGHAGLARDALHSARAGLIVGNDSCAQPVVEAVDMLREYGETRHIGSGRILQVMNSTVTINLATLFGVQGASWTVSGACASGAHAVGQALMLIRSGMQDIVMCGGAQEVNWESMASFDAIGAFAPYEPGDDPTAACKPFDVERGGLVPSGGAAMLVLESLDHARARRANILAEVVSYAFSSDGEHVTQPGGHGAVRAMQHCLQDGKVSATEVEYVNAHATGTPVGDVVEGRAILEVFAGERTPPVSSTKSMTGHECWMAGASELVYSLLMMHGGFIAPNINTRTVEPDVARLDIVVDTRDTTPRVILSNSFGFGGTNAAVLVRSFED